MTTAPTVAEQRMQAARAAAYQRVIAAHNSRAERLEAEKAARFVIANATEPLRASRTPGSELTAGVHVNLGSNLGVFAR